MSANNRAGPELPASTPTRRNPPRGGRPATPAIDTGSIVGSTTGRGTPKSRARSGRLPPLTPRVSNAYGSVGVPDMAQNQATTAASSDFQNVFRQTVHTAQRTLGTTERVHAQTKSEASSSNNAQATTSQQNRNVRGVMDPPLTTGRGLLTTTAPQQSTQQAPPARFPSQSSAEAGNGSYGRNNPLTGRPALARATDEEDSDEESEVDSPVRRVPLPATRRPSNYATNDNESFATVESMARASGRNLGPPPPSPRRPSTGRVLKHMFNRSFNWQWLAIWLCIFTLFTALLARVYMYQRSAPLSTIFNSLDEFYFVVYGSREPAYTIKINAQIAELQKDVDKIKSNVQVHEMMINVLKNHVPENVLVRKNKQTGEWDIPEEFWVALRGRLRGAMGEDLNTAWKEFLSKQRNQMQQHYEQLSNKHLDARLANQHVISKDMLLDHVRGIKVDLDSELTKIHQRLDSISQPAMNKAAAEAVIKAAEDYLSNLPQHQIDALAQSTIIQNIETSLKSVNFFSPGLGAVVDPGLTSPTRHQNATIAQWLYKRLDVTSPYRYPNAPLAALLRWEEATDCWCAALSSDRGKAQIGIHMPKKMYPTKLTIEHIPLAATFDITSAPKDLELWVEVENEEQRARVAEAAARILDSPPPVEALGKAGAKFVLVSKMAYDIKAVNYMQTFGIDVDLHHLGVPVRKAVVRAATNWGKDTFTCFYRLRMHGDKVE